MAAKNILTITFALLFLLLLRYYVAHTKLVYDFIANKGNMYTNNDLESYQVNTKSDTESVKVITHVQDFNVDENNINDDVLDLDVLHSDDTKTLNVDEDSTNDNPELVSDPDQAYIENNVDNNNNHKPNTKSDLDSADKITNFDDLQVITTITPQSQVLFPYPKITRQPHEILNSPWATKMKAKLESAKVHKQLTYVTVSMNYLSVLINWLIYANLNAKPLMENLLVVCVDQHSHEILSRKGILSQLVQVTDIIYSMEDMDDNKVFSARVITRLTVLRLLNYWGYDVLSMDIDALLINNVQPIFDHFHDGDIIVSTANAKNCRPWAALKAWQFCLCIGLLLIRGNTNTERMWQELGSTPVQLAASDQTRLTSILIKSNITWAPFDYDTNRYLRGTSQNKNITVIALPQDMVCRNQCNAIRLSSYYAYHPMTTHHVFEKHDRMIAQKVWRISDHWNMTLNSVQSTTDWLNEVTV